MGLRQSLREFQQYLGPQEPSTDIERDLSVDAWASMFSFNNLTYGGYPLIQTLVGNKEDIGQSFESYVRSAYQSNGVVFACMLVRQMVISDIRFLFRELVDGRPGKVFAGSDGRSPGNRDLGLLMEPWTGATTGDLLAHMIQDADIAGNSFVLRQGPRLRTLRPDWVTIVCGGRSKDSTMWDLDSEVIGYVYKPGGVGSSRPAVPLLPEEVAHFAPYPDPLSPHRGMSWLTPVLREILSDSGMTSHKKAFLDQGATVNIGLKFDPATTKTQFDEAKTAFLEGHQGVANAYKTLFLLGAEPVAIGSNFQQMDFAQVQGKGETRIAAASGIHPAIVGLSEGLQGSSLNAGNFGAARRLTADKTLRPLWRNICGSLSRIIITPPGSELWYDETDVAFLREDAEDIANIQQIKAQAIRHLLDGGFTAESVVDAIMSDDMSRLKHTGLFSVQLQAPGSTKMPAGEAPGETPVGPGTKPEELKPGQATDKPAPQVVPNGKALVKTP